jgi:putative ABC transport system permease protein
MSGLARDVRLALRGLRARWRLSLLVTSTMAVTIGATVSGWAYLSYFLRPTLDAPEPERLAWLRNPAPDDPYRRFSIADWSDLAAARRELFVEGAATRFYGASLQTEAATIHVYGMAASGEYFELLGARPSLGRLFGPEDDRPSAPPVLVLDHLTWRRHFGSDPGIVGRTVTLDGRHPCTVIGVTEPDFQGAGVWAGVYTPIAHAGPLLSGNVRLEDEGVDILVRLRPGLALPRATQRLASAVAGIEEARPLAVPREARLQSVERFDTAFSAEPIYLAARVLMASVLLLLLLGCANVASLLLAQGVARRRETALHEALGASRLLLSRRFLLESVLLSGAGGVAGLFFVPPLLRLIEHYLRMELPVSMGDFSAGSHLIVDEGELSLVVAAVSVGTGLLFGLAPAIQTRRLDLVSALKGSAAFTGRGTFRGLDLLVVTQVALSVALLSGAVSLGQTLQGFETAPLGFDDRGLLLASIYVPKERLRDPADGPRLMRELASHVTSLAGVESGSLVRQVPLSIQSELRVEIEGERATVRSNAVDSNYLETLGIPLVAGRFFDERDDADAPAVAVLNRAAATRLFSSRSAVGESLTLPSESGPGERVEVVGVVADVLDEPAWRPRAPMVFFPFRQRPSPRATMVLRSAGPVERELRALLRSEYPDLAVLSLVPFEEQKKHALADQRMNADLSGGIGVIALFLSTFGVFSVMSYLVSQREREIGIRMAVGAEHADVRRFVLGGALRRAAIGIAIGVAGAWAQARVLENLLPGVDARNVWPLVAPAAALALTAVLAAWIPARRAASLEPLKALRLS